MFVRDFGREGVGGDGLDTPFLARREKLHCPALLWKSCPAGVPGGSDGSSEPGYKSSATTTDQENANNSPATFSTAIKYTTIKVILF